MSLRTGAVSLLAALAVSGAAFAQPVTVPIPPRWMVDVPARDAAPAPDQRTRDLQDQAWAMVGREDRIAPDPKPQCPIADIDPIDAIARAAETAQIVIINESHDSPRDRAFIADVAVRLASLGYGVYAAETLFDTVAARGEDDPPKVGDGWYAQEPVYGALLRAVKREGYKLVAYESQTPPPSTGDFVEDINRRESEQASNLINRVFVPDRAAKVLIHVGYAHNDESLQRFPRTLLRPREIAWLARRLKDVLGADPLTVDQTMFSAERPGICTAGANGAALPQGRDLHVGHPTLTFDRHRPMWRDDTGARVTEVPRRLKRADERIIVEARNATDPADAVPVDRVLIDPGEDIPLLLPPGRYKVRAWLEDRTLTPDVALTVRPAPRQPAVSRVSTRRTLQP